MPGIQPVEVVAPPGQCLVAHGYPKDIVDDRRDLRVDVSDCTVYTVTHVDFGHADVTQRSVAEMLLEQALQAISEVTIWNKTLEEVGKISAFTRQVGRVDLKFFFIETPDQLIAWKNPLFWAERSLAGMMAGVLGNMIVENGPAASPVPAVTRRVMAALDLINLGFYTESFVSAFSLADDLSQEVIKAGMSKKGLDLNAQKQLLRAIKEERLKIYLTNLAKLCDWKSLEEAEPALFDRLAKANTLRNNIMHGSARLTRTEALQSVNTLLDTIGWLRKNPFGFAIAPFPILHVAEGDFLQLEHRKESTPPAQNEGSANGGA